MAWRLNFPSRSTFRFTACLLAILRLKTLCYHKASKDSLPGGCPTFRGGFTPAEIHDLAWPHSTFFQFETGRWTRRPDSVFNCFWSPQAVGPSCQVLPRSCTGYQLALYSLCQLPINENSLVESDTYQCVTLSSPSIMTLSSITHQWKNQARKRTDFINFLGASSSNGLIFPSQTVSRAVYDGLDNRVCCSCQIRTAAPTITVGQPFFLSVW